ncbi:MAG: type II toxin-antitoxin system RatA family toxin [Hyphomonadaceae bacterium]
MSAAILEAEKTLPYPARALCKLVGDVKAYPRFIPWLKSLRVLSEKPLGEGWEGVAEAIVGWKAITEKFSTKVRCAPEEGAVDVALVKGPFRTLENRWRFEDTPSGARVRFWIEYEFKNPLLQHALNANRARAAEKIMAAFEAEARKRLAHRV